MLTERDGDVARAPGGAQTRPSKRNRGWLIGASALALTAALAAPAPSAWAQTTFDGPGAGTSSTDPDLTAFGANAGTSITGDFNSYVGDHAGLSVLGDCNVGVGDTAGQTVTGSFIMCLLGHECRRWAFRLQPGDFKQGQRREIRGTPS